MRHRLAGCLIALTLLAPPAWADTLKVTGADGYAAVIALGEIAPPFADRPIQIADHMNGALLPDHALRLVVPGDKRGGRSVPDVARVDIE
jgi:hypothetical protein